MVEDGGIDPHALAGRALFSKQARRLAESSSYRPVGLGSLARRERIELSDRLIWSQPRSLRAPTYVVVVVVEDGGIDPHTR